MAVETTADLASQGSWFEQFVSTLDERLRRWEDIVEYSHRPECIFRMHVARSPESFALPGGGHISPGDLLIHLHYWNDHIPPIGPKGPSLAWAKYMRHAIEFSFWELTAYMAAHPELDSVKAIRADMIPAGPRQTEASMKIMGRLGWRVLPKTERLTVTERLRRSGQNILARLLVRANNPEAARGRVLRIGRVPFCISRKALMRRYGPAALAGSSPRISGRASREPPASLEPHLQARATTA